MSESLPHRVRRGWVAVALVVALGAVLFLAGGFQTGRCTDYVASPGVCTIAGEDPGSWVLLALGGLLFVFALYQAFRRR